MTAVTVELPDEIAAEIESLPDKEKFVSQALSHALLEERELRRAYGDEVVDATDRAIAEGRKMKAEGFDREKAFEEMRAAREALATDSD